MNEIFSHDLSFAEDEDTEDVFVISGKDWENDSFKLYLKEDDVRNLMWQMNFFMGIAESGN